METAILISILGAVSAILVSFTGAWLTNRNTTILQTRKLKEQHYEVYIEAVHYLVGSNDKEIVEKYVFARDKMFLIASEEVIIKMIEFEDKGVGKTQELHDVYLTKMVKEIRKDLKLKDKNFPDIYFKRS